MNSSSCEDKRHKLDDGSISQTKWYSNESIFHMKMLINHALHTCMAHANDSTLASGIVTNDLHEESPALQMRELLPVV
eukprot:scaffold1561_cov129-Cylindrotheca_fusiformis.AAC.26